MDYNISHETLKFPEYGRNVKLMIDYVANLKDRNDQEKSAQAIISVMGNLSPKLKENPDFEHILWDHLVIMSDYKLKDISPYSAPEEELANTKPEPLEYNYNDMKYPTFGRIIERLIEKAKNIDDSTHRNELIKTITNHMKKSYLLWNKENINDEVIFNVLKEISGGELEVTEEGLKLIDSKDFMTSKYNRNNQNNNSNINGNTNSKQNRQNNKQNRQNNKQNRQNRRFHSKQKNS